MEKCYKYLGCEKRDCIMHGNTDEINCWEVETTLCNNRGMERLQIMKKDKCKYCFYYKAVMERNGLK